MDPQNCYICTMTSVFYSRNLFKTKSKYSETRIYDFICKFLGKLPSTRPTSKDDCVCIECLGKIDEYDLATITARRVEAELRDFLLHAESSIAQESKVHSVGSVGASGDNCVALNDDDNNIVRPIETIEMVDQFKIEHTESNELSDLDDSQMNDNDDENVASDSDDEYHPSGNLRRQSHRKLTKMTRMASTKGQKQQLSNALDQQRNLKCTECHATFKR